MNKEIFSNQMGERKCMGCDKSLENGCVFTNLPKNCEQRATFTYMEIGQSMHMECYIERVIQGYFDKLANKNDFPFPGKCEFGGDTHCLSSTGESIHMADELNRLQEEEMKKNAQFTKIYLEE